MVAYLCHLVRVLQLHVLRLHGKEFLGYVEVRKLIYSLSGIALNKMLQDIQQGDAFIFVSRFDNTSLDTSITMKAREMPK